MTLQAEPEPTTTEQTETGLPADSSAASSTSEPSPFVGDPGPGFDPAKTRSDPVTEPVPAGPLPAPDPVSEDQIRSALTNVGDGVHALFGIGQHDWVMTQGDLDRIAPPLTRIVNRYEPLQAVAGHSDEAAVAIGFGMYGWRTALERRAVNHAKQDQPAAAEPVDAVDLVPADRIDGLTVPAGYTPAGVRMTNPEQEN